MSVETLFLIAFILLIAEAFIPSLGLLGLGGFIAFVSGVAILLNAGETHFYGLTIESVIALGVLIFLAFAVFGYFVFRTFGKKPTTGTEYMIGQTATVKSWTKGKGIVTFEGEDWNATSDDAISKGDDVTIVAYDKMKLIVNKKG